MVTIHSTLYSCSLLRKMTVVIIFPLPLTFFLSSLFLNVIIVIIICVTVNKLQPFLEQCCCCMPACQAALHAKHGVFAKHGHRGFDLLPVP